MLFLGLIGEYVGKILKNVNKEEQYIVNYIKKKINNFKNYLLVLSPFQHL